MKATTMREAFEIAYDKIGAMEFDREGSKNAGYNVYRSTKNYYDYVCDLEERLEINYTNGRSENVWIDRTPREVADLKEALAKKDLETIKLKAKLYDLICGE